MRDPEPRATSHWPPADEGAEAPSIAHLAEAIEGKHRVRERLVRALARVPAHGTEPGARPFDPASGEVALPENDLELDLALNPLGEYLLNCELQSRSFTI